MVLVNGLDAWIERPGEAAEYPDPAAIRARGRGAAERCSAGGIRRRPLAHLDLAAPRWRDGGARAVRSSRHAAGRDPLAAQRRRAAPAALMVRPFLSGRDSHALHHANPSFRFEATARWRPDHVGAVSRCPSGECAGQRGLPARAPVVPELPVRRGARAGPRLRGGPGFARPLPLGPEAARCRDPVRSQRRASRPTARRDALYRRLRRSERARRGHFASRLERAGDAYLVRRGAGRTIVAGYPWFTDWGRDTFIALRGLCLATGRLAEARSILLEWAGHVSEGMLPNRFVGPGRRRRSTTRSTPRSGTSSRSTTTCAPSRPRGREVPAARPPAARPTPCAPSWPATAGHPLRHPGGRRRPARRGRARRAAHLDGREGGRLGRHPAHRQAGGDPGAVAQRAARRRASSPRSTPDLLEPRHGARSRERFWNEERGCLYDVVDADHVPGRMDASLRPNEILAVGGLPYPAARGDTRATGGRHRRAHALDAARPAHAGAGSAGLPAALRGRRAEPRRRLPSGHGLALALGPFVEAWVRVRGGGGACRAEARRRFLDPLLEHLGQAGVGHVSEIADADAPHVPRGCPFQAWSVGEALRLDLEVLSAGHGRRSPRVAAEVSA